MSKQVVIIGAPRSGTNMLRDLLCTVNGVATCPCDEINYIWRHGNVAFPSDAFTEDMATVRIRGYIRKQFNWVGRRYRAHTVVEKTCANSLRVGFVDRILMEPYYVFIYRDGVDAAASAMRSRGAKIDLPYLLRKARFVPFTDMPYHMLKYAGNRLSRHFSREKRLKSWGPILPAHADVARTQNLADLCAMQWRACVEMSLEGFNRVPSERVLSVRYEDLVNSKYEQVSRIGKFLDMNPEELMASSNFQGISAASVGKGYSQFSPEVLSRVSALMEPIMLRLGY